MGKLKTSIEREVHLEEMLETSTKEAHDLKEKLHRMQSLTTDSSYEEGDSNVSDTDSTKIPIPQQDPSTTTNTTNNNATTNNLPPPPPKVDEEQSTLLSRLPSQLNVVQNCI